MYELSEETLSELLAGEPPYRVRQVWQSLHARAQRFEEMSELPKALRERLTGLVPLALEEVVRSIADDGETVKWLFTLHDGASIETVYMAYPDRVTVCVSSQAGCAMGCTFCATGQSGFTRHLSASEIVAQVLVAIREARPRRLGNVVFMGMGEPLANYDSLRVALHRLHDHVGISARHLTVSTVGVVPGIERLIDEPLPVNLALSLHAANDALRDRLVPLNRRYPLATLADVARRYVERTHRRLSLEWALIDGVNDRPRDAVELARFARPLAAHVNLIVLNPTPGYPVRGSGPERVDDFLARLGAERVNATVRVTRGAQIEAACGQLARRANLESTDLIHLSTRNQGA